MLDEGHIQDSDAGLIQLSEDSICWHAFVVAVIKYQFSVYQRILGILCFRNN
jgi:hypothetical protein